MTASLLKMSEVKKKQKLLLQLGDHEMRGLLNFLAVKFRKSLNKTDNECKHRTRCRTIRCLSQNLILKGLN